MQRSQVCMYACTRHARIKSKTIHIKQDQEQCQEQATIEIRTTTDTYMCARTHTHYCVYTLQSISCTCNIHGIPVNVIGRMFQI